MLDVIFLSLQIASFIANNLKRNWPRDLYEKVARSLWSIQQMSDLDASSGCANVTGLCCVEVSSM